MGSWNATCGITNFPICWNSEIVAFIMLENVTRGNDHGTDRVHATDDYIPVCLPFYGKYDDYGRIAVDWDLPSNNFNMKMILPHIIDNFDFDNLADGYKEIWLKLEDAFHGGDIVFESSRYGPARLSRMFVHKWVYNLLSTQELTETFGDEPNTLVEYSKLTSKIYLNTVERVKFTKERVKNLEINEKQEFINSRLLYIRQDYIISSHFRLFDSVNIAKLNMNQYKHWFVNQAIEEKPLNIEISRVIDEYNKFRIFVIQMQFLRKKFTPPSGAGSQNEDWDLHIVLNKKSLEYAEYMKDRWDE